MKTNIIGKDVDQKEGFKAFVPGDFPPAELLNVSGDILHKIAQAGHLVGKLDGTTHQLPDVDFFLKMFIFKDATASAQIEGTKATMIDALEMEAGLVSIEDTDADDILHYIEALSFGIERLCDLPMSKRFIKELHSKLMTNARATHFADPGEWRRSQNWIAGTAPSNALYVPPPVEEMERSLNDFENYLHNETITLPLIHTAYMHSQFETIHPFLDGNGRTGRLLITLQLYRFGLLEKPVLFLSSYFKQNQKEYYRALHEYHHGNPEVWLEFFIDGVTKTARDAITACRSINELYIGDTQKIQQLGKRESESGMKVLLKLFGHPIVTSTTIMNWTSFSRNGAQNVIDRLVEMEILEPRDENEKYGKSYSYRRYFEVFVNHQ